MCTDTHLQVIFADLEVNRKALTKKKILSYDCVLVKGSFVTWAPAALRRSGTTDVEIELCKQTLMTSYLKHLECCCREHVIICILAAIFDLLTYQAGKNASIITITVKY